MAPTLGSMTCNDRRTSGYVTHWLVLLLCVAPVLAQDRGGDPALAARRAHVAAAVDNAVASLRDQVLRTPVGRNQTVETILKRMNRPEELTKTLQRAEQIGGP